MWKAEVERLDGKIKSLQAENARLRAENKELQEKIKFHIAFERSLRMRPLDDEQSPSEWPEPPKSGPGKWCRDPSACKGKGYCPLDPACGN